LTELLREHPTPELPDTWLPEFHRRRQGLRTQRDNLMARQHEFLRHAPQSPLQPTSESLPA
ncbi:hypothetical protein RZS08_02915, partial [Arthrospira platensis SPKY1]|nr:hypothetical protein [Arthrospira platensis SPKY1]